MVRSWGGKRAGLKASATLLVVALMHAGAAAQTRPVYGGTLRVETSAEIVTLDPAVAPTSAAQSLLRDRLAALVFEGLTRLDDNGVPQPHLAISWTHDPDHKQWQFRLRSGITFHDGAPLTASTVAQSLEARMPMRRVSVFGETLVIQSSDSMPGLLAELAGPRGAIARRDAQGNWQGTGPFRIEPWEAGARAVFRADDAHWRGRPYLDSVEVQMNRPLREQQIALELGRADVIELSAENVRRAQQAGLATWSSADVELMAIAVAPERIEEEAWRKLALALSLAADRAAIHNVLLQKQGEVAGGLLPQWMSGYAFLFSAAQDTERGSRLVTEASAAIPGRGRAALTARLGHDASDALARVVAERIAVSARAAGLNLQIHESGGDFQLVRIRLRNSNPSVALAGVGRALALAALAEIPPYAELDEVFEAERAVVESGRVVPLLYLPESFGLGARVRGWDLPAPWAARGAWRLEEVWLVPGSPRANE
ncbi:MAG TPA: ABC transporter substrate-binding protein [Candidatus Acidoferrales bacterium]